MTTDIDTTTTVSTYKEYSELEKQMEWLKLTNKKAYNKMRKQTTGKFSDGLMKRLKK